MKRYKLSVFFISVFASVVFTACYYDKEDNLYGNIPCKTGAISYVNDVAPVLNANCYACHSTSNAPILGSNIKLDSYANLTAYLQNSQSAFTGSINQDGSVSPMPKGGTKLAKCNLQLITDWISQGKLDN